MISNRFRVFCAISFFLLAALACTLPLAKSATPTPQILVTPSVTVKAIVSETARPASMTPSPTVQPDTPTETAQASQTATETALPVGVFPTETPTPTLEPIFADVMKETYCRTGPGSHYDLVLTFQAGTRLIVVARDLGGGFIVIQNPDKPEEQCYVLANNVKLTGETSILPQFTPLPSPTAAPGFTAAFKKFDLCKGDVFAQFTIQNTGSVPFRSAYIKVTNLKTNEVAEKVVNAFDLYVGCMIAKNIAPLDSGAMGYLSSELFLHDPRGNKLRAVIQVCTEKSMKGACINTIIEIQP